ncbi:MAG: rod shape-determining protein RodA [Ignavibacteriae bacterium]|nr:rod shape-determining protein RodA [Ignavibacteriota bacterium]
MLNYLQRHFDLQIGISSLLLTIIGLVSVYSATYDARASDIFFKQLAWSGAGTVVLIAMALFPYRLLQTISIPAWLFSLLLLVIVLLLGKTVSGSTSWFNLGSFRIQPSEFAKITTVLALASYLSRSDVSLRNPRDLFLAGGIVLAPVALIMMQPDFGTAVIYGGMAFAVMYWGGASQFTLLSVVAPAAAAVGALFGTTPFLIVVAVMGVLIYLTKEHRLVAAVVFSFMVLVGISVQFIYDGMKPYQQRRIDTFLDPGADPLGAGYNILQSKVAIGSGGVFGKGYLHGSQTQLNFIPEQWTDFIFCVPGEEFGFIGAATVLVLFAVFLMRGVTLASKVKSKYASYVAIGLTATIATHVFINIGMALGLFPVIGVPLPFLSYGGSSLLSNAAMVGILMNLYTNRKEY